MRRAHSHHRKDHGPSLLATKGLLAIVKAGDGKIEIGRHHFVAAESVREIYEDGAGMVHMTVTLDEPLSYIVPDGVEYGSWLVEMWSGDQRMLLDTFPGELDAQSGDALNMRGPLKLTIEPLKAKVLLRTYRDTDGPYTPSDFRDDDDD